MKTKSKIFLTSLIIVMSSCSNGKIENTMLPPVNEKMEINNQIQNLWFFQKYNLKASSLTMNTNSIPSPISSNSILSLKKWWTLIWWMSNKAINNIKNEKKIKYIFFYINNDWCEWKKEECLSNEFSWFWVNAESDVDINLKSSLHASALTIDISDNKEEIGDDKEKVSNDKEEESDNKEEEKEEDDNAKNTNDTFSSELDDEEWFNWDFLANTKNKDSLLTYLQNMEYDWEFKLKNNYIIRKDKCENNQCILFNEWVLYAPYNTVKKKSMPLNKSYKWKENSNNTWIDYCYNLKIWDMNISQNWFWTVPRYNIAWKIKNFKWKIFKWNETVWTSNRSSNNSAYWYTSEWHAKYYSNTLNIRCVALLNN